MSEEKIDIVVKSDIDGIKSTEDLKRVLHTEAELRISAEKKSDELSKQIAEDKEAIKAIKAELDQVKSKNFVEKYSTMATNTKEETLFKMGKLIWAMTNKRRDVAEELGAKWLSADQEKAWTDGKDVITQKSKLGTPLYSDATTGSYTVAAEYATEVLSVSKQASQLMGRVTEMPMGGITKYVPKQNATASCKWLTLQSSTKSEVNPTFAQVTLTSQTMGIYTAISEELQEDSFVNIAAYYRDIFGEAWGYEFDYQAAGANADPFTGMLHGADNVLTMSAGKTSFENVEFDDLYDLIGQLTTVNKREGGVFIVHCTVFDILRKVKDANGNYIYQQPNGTQPGMICGYPYIICDAMTALSSDAISTKFIVFGNPKHFIFGNRLGLEFKVFENTSYAATEDEIIFRCRARAAFKIGIEAAFASLRTAAA